MNDQAQDTHDTRSEPQLDAFELELPDGEDVSDIELEGGPLSDINYGF